MRLIFRNYISWEEGDFEDEYAGVLSQKAISDWVIHFSNPNLKTFDPQSTNGIIQLTDESGVISF